MYKEYTPFQQNTISYSVISPSVMSPSVISPSVISPSVISPSVISPKIIEGIDPDVSTVKQIYQNYLDISNNIDKYSSTANYLSNNNNIYHYNDEEDPNTLFNYNRPKDIHTAMKDDIAELQLYQNSIYITGIIACGTLLISAILISKK